MNKLTLACLAVSMMALLQVSSAHAQSNSQLCQNYQACITQCYEAEDKCTWGLNREGNDPKLGSCRQTRDQCQGKQGCASVFDQSDPDTTGGTLAARAGCF